MSGFPGPTSAGSTGRLAICMLTDAMFCSVISRSRLRFLIFVSSASVFADFGFTGFGGIGAIRPAAALRSFVFEYDSTVIGFPVIE